MNKQIILIGFLLSGFIFMTNNASAQLQQQTPQRFTVICGLHPDINITPDEYLQFLSRQYNYDINAMPPDIQELYTCVNTVMIEDRANNLLSGLGNSITREGNN
jgi:hypothetical protein